MLKLHLTIFLTKLLTQAKSTSKLVWGVLFFLPFLCIWVVNWLPFVHFDFSFINWFIVSLGLVGTYLHYKNK